MSEPVYISLTVTNPIELELFTAPPVWIVPGQGTAYYKGEKGEKGEKGDPFAFSTGSKSSLVDSGTYGQVSITDDYVYWCVQSGEAGQAIWKRTILFQT